MNSRIKSEVITVLMPSTDQLHISRLYQDHGTPGTPVLLLHSIMQDGSFFGSEQGTGLGFFLANQGFDVYVADLRGRGKSWPKLSARSHFSAHQVITEDLPALSKKIVSIRGPLAQIWIGHGWGSVVMCSYYARYGDSICPIAKMVHFAPRRKIHRVTFLKQLLFGVGWKKCAGLFVTLMGYMPSKALKLGSCNESKGNYKDYLAWSASEQWCDSEDGFDYGAAILQRQLPPGLYFAASGDRVYGDTADVREFIRELGRHDCRLMILSRNGGSHRDYNHRAMLNHRDCESDHFPLLLNWLQQA